MTQSRLANAHNDGMDSYGHIISPQSQVLEGESVPAVSGLLPYLCRADTSTSLGRGQTGFPPALRDWIEIIARTFSLK